MDSHRPICVKCKVPYKLEKESVVAEEMAKCDGYCSLEQCSKILGSYKLWNADLWKCPKCENLIISGFGNVSFAGHFQSNYKEQLEKTSHKRYQFYD